MIEEPINLPKRLAVLKPSNKKKKLLAILAIILLFFAVLSSFYFSKLNFWQIFPGNNITTTFSTDDNSQPAEELMENPVTMTVSDVKAADGKLTSKIIIENKGSFGYQELFYTASLIGKAATSSATIDGQQVLVMEDPLPLSYKDSEVFSLGPNEKREMDLQMVYPAGTDSGSYSLSISIIPRDEHVIAKEVTSVEIESAGPFLVVVPGSCKLEVSNQSFDSNMGPNLDPDQSPKAYCEVKNVSSQSISAQAEVFYAERFVYGYPNSDSQKVPNQKAFTLKPGQTERVEFELPALNKPQVYEAVGQLIDSQGKYLSPQMPFRWVIRGPSAVVKSAEITSHNIASGQEVKVSILAAPSMDLFWRQNPPSGHPNRKAFSASEGAYLKKPNIEMTLSSEGQLCSQKKIGLLPNALTWEAQTITVRSDIECKDPILSVKILEGDSELASLEKKYISGVNSNNFFDWQQKGYVWILIVGVSVVLATVALVLFYFKGKGRGSSPLAPLLILIGGTILCSGLLLVFVPVTLAVLIRGPAEIEGIPMNQRNVYMERDGRSQGLNFQGFRQVTGGASTVTLQGNALNVLADIYVISSFGCGNYNLAYILSVFIDGNPAQIVGNSSNNNTIFRVTRNNNSQQTLASQFTTYLSGVDLTQGPHSLEVKLVPIEVYFGGSWQVQGKSTDLPDPGGNNCGLENDTCYGSLKYSWGAEKPMPNVVASCVVPDPDQSPIQAPEIAIIWKKTANTDSYELYRKTPGGNTQRIGGVITGNPSNPNIRYADRAVVSGTGYSYQVRSIKGTPVAESDWTSEVAALSCTPPPWPFRVFGSLFLDQNNNGYKESGEQAFTNQRIQLLDSSGNVIAETVSSDGIRRNEFGAIDDPGDYTFKITRAGVYTVRLVAPPPGFATLGISSFSFEVIEGWNDSGRWGIIRKEPGR